ncbi:hypothetical protein AOLI_G00290060 [Acnodon oligacanthus]
MYPSVVSKVFWRHLKIRYTRESLNMAKNVLRNSAAGSDPEPDHSAAARSLQRLADRQLQVILGGLHQMFTRDEITTMNADIEKIVTTVLQKVILPKLWEVLNVDARSHFLARPGSSICSLESVTKEVVNAIMKTVIGALDDKPELLAPSRGSVELRNSSVEPTSLDGQVTSLLQRVTNKSFWKVGNHATRTKAARDVKKILLNFSSYLESSPRSRHVHTSQRDRSVKPTPSDCSFKAFDVVNSIIHGISGRLYSTPPNAPEETLWYTACSAFNCVMTHLKEFSTNYRQKPPEVDPLEISVEATESQSVTEHEPPKSRERVSMTSLLDTMMASLGLQSPGPLNTLEELSAAAKRVEDLLSTTASQEFSNMVERMLMDRLSSVNMTKSILQLYPYIQQPLATDFLGEFAHRSVKYLVMCCKFPRPASTTPPPEALDKVDLIAEEIVNGAMDKASALSDEELDAVDSNAEETAKHGSHRSELSTAISVDALRCCIRVILHKVQEMSSTGVHGSPLFIDEDQVQKVTAKVKGILALFTAVTVEDGEHAVQKLHSCIVEAVYARLLERMRSENQLIEAVKDQGELLAGSLALSIVRAIKSVDPKDLYRPASVESGSSPSVKEEPLVSSQTTDHDVLLSSQVSSTGLLTSDTKGHATLSVWLVLRTLAQSAATSSDLTKEASSNDPKELIKRILSEFSASSSAAKLEEVLTGLFNELLQKFGEEGFLHKALDPLDSTFDEALMTALQKHLDADAAPAGPETERPKKISLKKLKNIFCLKVPKSRKDNNSGHTACGSSHATSKEEKPRSTSICSRMFCWFRKRNRIVPL